MFCGDIFEKKLLIIAKKDSCSKCLKEKISVGYRKSEEAFLSDIKNLYNRNVEVLTPYSGYINAKTKLNCRCLKCGNEWSVCLNSLLSGVGCLPCSLRDFYLEKDFVEILCELGVKNIERNNRVILGGKEIDVYLPDYKIGFELNGLYWHSDKFVIGRRGALQEKFMLAEGAGVRMFQVFEDEIKNKRDLVKFFVAHKIKNGLKTINTRSCSVVELDQKNKNIFKEFVEKNHISGWTNCKFSFALMYNGEIVSVISFRRPFTKKYKDTIEVARFCCQSGKVVPGAFGKLYKFFVNSRHSNGFKSVLSYADLRFGNGGIYLNNGFEFIGKTDPNYFYTNFKSRFHRFHYRAKNGKTEKQVAENEGVHKIYDAGSYIFLKNIISQ